MEENIKELKNFSMVFILHTFYIRLHLNFTKWFYSKTRTEKYVQEHNQKEK